MNLSPEINSKINAWLNGNYDDATKNEIKKLVADNNETELIDSFYKDLEFGTGGLRGLMGIGSNKMNRYTVAMTTQGIINYLKKSFPGEKIKIAIAHDSRNKSDFFADVTAEVFSANGAEVYFFKELRPTPLLSFAIRHFGCHSGVVITASHNPKEYNGYKAYWNDGAQMVAPHDQNVIDEVQKITNISEVKFSKISANIHLIGQEVDDIYIKKITSLSINPEIIKRQKDLKIVFTPIHGTGITLTPQLLKSFGFENVSIVESQSKPDGNFPTVIYPNPEEKEALSLAIEQAQKLDADLVLATDPDADRVGIAVKDDSGNFVLLNGNQTGTLLFYYMINAWQKAGKLTGKEFVVKTIVSSYIMDEIAKKFNVECFNVLTGFKFIAQLIRENEGKKTFIVGGEESYGYLVGDFVRDKDAVGSCAFIAEMAAVAKDQGKTLYDILIDLYVEFGFFKEKLISITKKGKSGADEIKAMMAKFRSNPPTILAGSKVVKLMDYEFCIEKNMIDGSTKPIELQKSDVLQFVLEDGTIISARPSGTEPKIKFYFSAKEKLENKQYFDQISKKLDQKILTIINDLGLN